jgi:hypothetical protein
MHNPPVPKRPQTTAGDSILGAVSDRDASVSSDDGGARQDAKPPEGSLVYTFTNDIDHLLAHSFAPGSDAAEVELALNLRFPAPDERLTRVRRVRASGSYNHRTRTTITAQTYFVVFPAPYLESADGWNYDELVELTSRHGDLYIGAEALTSLRQDAEWDDSPLVGEHLSGTDYALLKYRPGKAKARVKTAHTKVDKAKAAQLAAQEAAEMRKAVDALSRVLLADLHRYGRDTPCPPCLHHVITFDDDPHHADDAEPARGRKNKWYYSAPTKPKRDCVRHLYSLVTLHQRFFGRRAYRRVPGWLALRSAYAQLPKGLDPTRWGLFPVYEPWWTSEMRARTPKPKPEPPPDEADDNHAD